MKVIIAGSRDITKAALVQAAVKASGYIITEVVSGGARGVDRLGEEFAKTIEVPVKIFPANWDKHGRAAGPIRNCEMAAYADALVAIWDGSSRGTLHMINEMGKRNKPFYVHRTDV